MFCLPESPSEKKAILFPQTTYRVEPIESNACTGSEIAISSDSFMVNSGFLLYAFTIYEINTVFETSRPIQVFIRTKQYFNITATE